MNKKLLISLSIIGLVAVIAVGATVAYFSSTQTSTNNTFTAGTIDLKIGDANVSYNGSTTIGFATANLTEQKFFNFDDLKPGDYGKDTIKIKVDSNPAWVCAQIGNVKSTEETLTDAEVKMGDTMDKGEIDQDLYITFYKDANCDGIKNETDTTIIPWTLLSQVGKFALADSQHGTAYEPNNEYCISKMWCFGKVDTQTNDCDGSTITNKSQSDKLTADISFEAIQSRHNDKFVCVSETRTCETSADCNPAGSTGSTCCAGQCVGFGAPTYTYINGQCQSVDVCGPVGQYESMQDCQDDHIIVNPS